jgi:pimeloyl-ACP methyl ester carboxylesterase
MEFATFQNKRVAYRVEGKGQPIMLVHGLCEDSTIWDEFSKGLVDNYRVIRPDLSGFGASEILPEHSVEMMADSLKAVLDELGVSRCVMIGHSLGGYVALAFQKKYPSVLQGLGLFHSHPFADTAEKKDERQKSIEFVQKNGHIIYVKQLIPKLFAELFATSNEFLINSLIHKATQYTPETIIGAQTAMLNRPDNSDVLRNCPCPVLLIVGKQDKVVPYDMSLQMLPLPSVSDVLILPKVAHMGIFTARDKTVKAVRDFSDLCLSMEN